MRFRAFTSSCFSLAVLISYHLLACSAFLHHHHHHKAVYHHHSAATIVDRTHSSSIQMAVYDKEDARRKVTTGYQPIASRTLSCMIYCVAASVDLSHRWRRSIEGSPDPLLNGRPVRRSGGRHSLSDPAAGDPGRVARGHGGSGELVRSESHHPPRITLFRHQQHDVRFSDSDGTDRYSTF
jgi:hypothetical protein